MNSWSFEVNLPIKQEENVLKQLKQMNNVRSWTLIAQIINEKFQTKDKNGKQCRERYINFVRPGLKQKHSKAWSTEEEDVLFQKYAEYGAKWTYLSTFIQTKSENSIKNKFYGSLRKFARKLNEIGRQQLRLKKNIKYDSILKPLQSIYIEQEQQYPILKQHSGLRDGLINLIKLEDNIDSISGIKAIKEINKFNLETRSLKFKKKKSEKNKKEILGKLFRKGTMESMSVSAPEETLLKKQSQIESQPGQDLSQTLHRSQSQGEQLPKMSQNPPAIQQNAFLEEEDIVISPVYFFPELHDQIDIYLSL